MKTSVARFASKLIPVVWLASGVFALVELSRYLAGTRGDLRPALLAFVMTTTAAGLVHLPTRWFRVLASACLVVTALSAVDLILHAPGSSVLGLSARFLDDFEINTTAASVLYSSGSSPYGLETSHGLRNTSNSFPFPTYYLYWLCSGGGRFSIPHTGLVLTILNLFTLGLLGWASIQLALDNGQTQASQTNRLLESLPIALALACTGALGAVLSGQTGALASAALVCGLVLSLPSGTRPQNLLRLGTGCLLLTLATLVKPNFCVALALFLTRPMGDPGIAGGAGRHPMSRWGTRLLPLGVVLLGLLMLTGATVVIPGGVGWTTYQAFVAEVLPVLTGKVSAPNNLSAVGLLSQLTPDLLSPRVWALLLAATALGVGLARRWDWPQWLTITLLISPITWATYTGLLLPVQIYVVMQTHRQPCGSLPRFLSIALVGALWIDQTWVGCLVLLGYLGLLENLSQERPANLVGHP